MTTASPNLKHIHPCVVCGKEFHGYADIRKRRTCSPGCSTIHKSRVWAANPNRISTEGKARILAATLARREIPLGPDMKTLLNYRRKAGLLPDGSPKPVRIKPRSKPTKIGGACVVCGKEFKAFPCENKKCCSVECSIVSRARVRRGVPHVVSAEGRRNITAGIMRNPEALRARLDAARELQKNHPLCGPFETNHSAKDWRFITPEGDLVECRNLNLFCRNRFGIEWNKWAAGLRNLTYWARGTGSWEIEVYKGWRVP